MRAPIKLNRSFWPSLLHSIIPSANDPRVLLEQDIDETAFSKAVSSFKFGTKLKSTQKNRFPITIRALCGLTFPQPPVVLDVGCSDGITSLDVMEKLPFTRYYPTDLNSEVYCKIDSGRGYFYDLHGKPILIAGRLWVIYSDTEGAIRPFGSIVRRMLKKAPPMGSEAVKITLVNPTLQRKLGDKVIFKRHDVLQSWTGEKVDLAIAANILNRCYFPDSQLSQAVHNLGAAVKESGYVTIIDNRKTEASTIFRVSEDSAEIVHRVHGGTDIESLALAALLAQRSLADKEQHLNSVA